MGRDIFMFSENENPLNVIKLKNVTYTYPEGKVPALKHVNLEIREGDFMVVLGASGSGKSTLGRLIAGTVPEFYGGTISGNVSSCEPVSILFQDPEKQLVMNTVERDLAFPLENLEVDECKMLRKVSETLSYLNISDLRFRACHTLSGGQKQKVALGATLVGGQRFLVLDEPISQLDPVNADEILEVLARLNKALGYTIVLIEQRVDKCFTLADRIVFMEDAEILFDGTPDGFVKENLLTHETFVPRVSSFFAKNEGASRQNLVYDVKSGRRRLQNLTSKISLRSKDQIRLAESGLEHVTAVHVDKLNFSYTREAPVLVACSFSLEKGKIMGIMGENGSGKSTLLRLICGLIKPESGRVAVTGHIGYVSQNPNDYLFHDTLEEELAFTLKSKGIRSPEKINETLQLLNIYKYKDRNPRDLSGGEKQRAAIASVLVADPEILILDEPTRGLDRAAKHDLAQILKAFKARHKTVILVTHDSEFTAEICDQVVLLFDGRVAAHGTARDVLTGGMYYTTVMNRLFRGFCDDVLTLDDALDVGLQPELELNKEVQTCKSAF